MRRFEHDFGTLHSTGTATHEYDCFLDEALDTKDQHSSVSRRARRDGLADAIENARTPKLDGHALIVAQGRVARKLNEFVLGCASVPE